MKLQPNGVVLSERSKNDKPCRRVKICFLTLYNFSKVQPISLGNLCLGASIYHSEFGDYVDYSFVSFDDTSSEAEDIAEEIQKTAADLLFVGAYVWNEKLLNSVISRIKEDRRETPKIVLGGLSVLYGPPDFHHDWPAVDLFAKGEGELIAQKLVKEHIFGDPETFLSRCEDIHGISTHRSFNARHAERAVVSLEDIYSPYLPYEKQKSFFDFVNGRYSYLFMESTRGCSFSCAFCSFDAQDLGFRSIEIERFSKELSHIITKNVEQIFFVDAIWGGTPRTAKMLLRELISKRPYFINNGQKEETFLYGYFRPEFIDAEFADLLAISKFSMVQIGLQTVNPGVDRVMRNNNINAILKNLPNLRAHRVPFQIDLIVGFPGDTLLGFKKSVEFVIEKCRPANFRTYTLAVNPGTPLARMAAEKGREWVSFESTSQKVVRSFSYSSDELNMMIRFGNCCVALYNYLIEVQAEEEEFSIQKFENFFEFLLKTEDSISEIILNAHQFEQKTEAVSKKINAFRKRNIPEGRKHRVIYGNLYTRGSGNES
jgi:radical SAM superfamily enzyme YgiQ (UPF0313 family)